MGANLAVIATDTARHVSDAEEALRLRMSILLEKPMASFAKEARHLPQLASKCGLRLFIGCPLRFDPGLGAASTWKKGGLVQGNSDLKPGTAIATFNFGGNYGPPSSPGGASGVSHTGIYLGQDASGVQILDQWNGSGGARTHTIPWNSWNGNSMEAGSKYTRSDNLTS